MDNQQVSGNENIKKKAGTVQTNPTRYNRVGLSGSEKTDETTTNKVGVDDSGINGAESSESLEFKNEAVDVDGDAPLSQGTNNRGNSGGAGGAQYGQGANTVSGGVEKKSEEKLLGQTHAGHGGFGTSGTSGTSSGGNQGYGSGIGQAGSQNGSTGYNAGSQGMPQKLKDKTPKEKKHKDRVPTMPDPIKGLMIIR